MPKFLTVVESSSKIYVTLRKRGFNAVSREFSKDSSNVERARGALLLP